MVKLIKWQQVYAERLALLANNNNIARNLTNAFPHPYTIENAKQFIAMTEEHTPTRIFAIEYNGEVVGAIGIHPLLDVFASNAELGYWLAEDYWGRGIATEAINQIVTYGFSTFRINRIFARPFGSNIGSQKVLEKCGFVLEATFKGTINKNGAVHDELVYALRH